MSETRRPESFVIYARTTPPPSSQASEYTLLQARRTWKDLPREDRRVWVRILPSNHDYATALERAQKPRPGETLVNTIDNDHP